MPDLFCFFLDQEAFVLFVKEATFQHTCSNEAVYLITYDFSVMNLILLLLFYTLILP